MKVTSVCWGVACSILAGGMLLPAMAQVTSDGTTNTVVNQSGNIFDILKGRQQGNNLFHSFSKFSVPTGGSATFDLTNTPNITTIFSRVTGGNISHIDGLIQTLNGNHPASLFLMNPNGIVFGQNASLNIGGSFVGTTANSITFADGTEFSAVNSTKTPLLTMSVPVGLQMGNNLGNIQINNTGHNVSAPSRQALRRGNTPSGLSVKTGNTLALVGGNVSLTGGILNAPDGQVELAAVATPDLVTIDANNFGWRLNYDNVSGFGDIQLGQQSLIEASNTGVIRLAGNNLRFFDGSLLLLENQSNQSAVGIELQATDTVEFAGISNTSIGSGVISYARSSGKGGDITITSDRIIGRDNGGKLRAYTFADADSGNITFNSRDITWKAGDQTDGLVEIRTLGTGNGGKLTINTERLLMEDSSFVSNVNGGSGNAGDVVINASDSVIVGPNSQFATLIGSSAVSANGNAGSITINTSKLAVRGGALISSSTYGSGNAGQINLNTSESIEISGSGFFATTRRVEPSTLQTSGILLPKTLRQFLGLPDIVTGSAGIININTPQLQITDGARMRVGHDSVGDAGKIQINSDSLKLNTQGQITATTASGKGGNIILNLQDSLIMRNNSLINTEALGIGNGGNITINSPIILGLENSDIIANAVEGSGGNIDITTQGIFGLKFREELTPESDITASSQFGVNGTVDINNFGVDPNSGLVELPANVTDSSQQIATGCSNTTDSSFVATGRGGIPQNPTQEVRSDVYEGLRLRTWSDVRDISRFQTTQPVQAQIPQSPQMLSQATGWRRNANGKIELRVAPSPAHVPSYLTCAAASQN